MSGVASRLHGSRSKTPRHLLSHGAQSTERFPLGVLRRGGVSDGVVLEAFADRFFLFRSQELIVQASCFKQRVEGTVGPEATFDEAQRVSGLILRQILDLFLETFLRCHDVDRGGHEEPLAFRPR